MTHIIHIDSSLDEYGDTVYNWWCDTCELGGSSYDYQQTDRYVERHMRTEHDDIHY